MNKFHNLRTVRELEWIELASGESTSHDLTAIDEHVRYRHGAFSFLNSCGVVNVGGTLFEVLPKVALSSDSNTERRALLNMLFATHWAYFRSHSVAMADVERLPIPRIIARMFVQEIGRAVRYGLHHEYRSEVGALAAVRGRMLFSHPERSAVAARGRVLCAYDEFTYDVDLNRFFFRMLEEVAPHIIDPATNKQRHETIRLLLDVAPMPYDQLWVFRPVFHRMNAAFRKAFELAQMLLKSLGFSPLHGRSDATGLLFEMNDLFEGYVGALCTTEFGAERVSLQATPHHLLRNHANGNLAFRLKPDILIRCEQNDRLILDTKWKRIDEKPSESDVYQMFAYVAAYSRLFQESSSAILVYPHVTGGILQKYSVPGASDCTIATAGVRLDNEEHTNADLHQIIHESGVSLQAASTIGKAINQETR